MPKNLKVENFLKDCSDNDIFKVINNVGKEIKDRMIELFKKHNCTSIEISSNFDLETRVNDIYGFHGFGDNTFDRWVKIKEFGFTDAWYQGKVCQGVLYLITDKYEQFSGDEIDEDILWDVYSVIKEEFEKYDKI